jgi:predicted nucleotidyltransferase
MESPELAALIERGAAILREEGATEVYLFGSAANGSWKDASDIDFAVRGLPDAHYFRAVGRLLESLHRSVDVLDLDGDTPLSHLLRERGGLRRVA